MPTPRFILALTILFALVPACTATHKESSKSDPSATFVSAEEFQGIYFKANAPQRQEPIESALSNTLGDSKSAMNHDLELINKFENKEKFRVVGFTDNIECSISSDCDELSFRRAKLFQDWLIKRGIPASRFRPPRGYGNTRPIGSNLTESGRAMNRRAHISYGSDLDN